MDKHLIISDIKRVASELGRHPTRREFIERAQTGYSFESCFGTWSDALRASFGTELEQSKSTQRRISEFFSKNIDELLSRNERASHCPLLGPFTPTLCIPDLHFPWASDALSAIYAMIPVLKPKRIIQLGDLYDMFSYSKFPRSKMIILPQDEISAARRMAENMWSIIKSHAPDAELIQLLGNHDVRPMKRVIESNASELEAFMDFKSLYRFEGVHTVYDTREMVIYDNINFTHGHLSHGTHRTSFKSHVVHGHTHNGRLTTGWVEGKFLFELDCGFLGNPSAVCFEYTPKKITNWHLGFGFISELGPQFIPL